MHEMNANGFMIFYRDITIRDVNVNRLCRWVSFSRQSNIYNASNFTALVEVDGCISSIMCQCFVITFLHVSNLSRHSVPACTLLMDTHCYVTLNVRHLQLALIHTRSIPEQSGLESVGGQGFQRRMRERSA